MKLHTAGKSDPRNDALIRQARRPSPVRLGDSPR